MHKVILEKEAARKKLASGVEKLSSAVGATLGAKGRYAVLERPFGAPVVTNDGVTIAKEIELEDKFENMGVQLVKESAIKTNEVAGDGTTSSTILANAIVQDGLRNVTAGSDPIAIRRGIQKATEKVIELVKSEAIDVSSSQDIAHVGTISAGDEEIGNKIAEAMEIVGRDGVITVEESQAFGIDISTVQGLQFNNGYLSPYFTTDTERMVAELENPLILIVDGALDNVESVMGVVEGAIQNSRSLFIIANSVSDEVLNIFVVNKLRGVITSAIVKSPSFGDRRSDELQDIATVVGANVVGTPVLPIKDATINDCGSARSVKIDANKTIIVDGSGNEDAINERKNYLKTRIKETKSEFEQDKYKERLAKLAGGVAVIKVGAATESELVEKRFRVEDALMATRAAVDEGIVHGGGFALAKAGYLLENSGVGDEKIGYEIVKRATQIPLKTIASNAGYNGDTVYEKAMETDTCLNVETGEYGNMIDLGVIDPVKVVRSALENAVSVAGLIIISDVAVMSVDDAKDTE